MWVVLSKLECSDRSTETFRVSEGLFPTFCDVRTMWACGQGTGDLQSLRVSLSDFVAFLHN